jgi:hypothetical protein
MNTLSKNISATLRHAQGERNKEQVLNRSPFMLSLSKHRRLLLSSLNTLRKVLFAVTLLWTLPVTSVWAAALDETLAKRKPEATIDLATKQGVESVKGDWRYSDTKIIEVDFKAAGADGQPTGAPNKAYDLTPHAGRADFDDSKWEVIDPTTLDKRRSAGRFAFNWYRIKITVPQRIGSLNPTGSTAVFAT